MSPRSATAIADRLTDGATLEGAKANAVKMTPGHGKAGRHPTRAMLDALSGNKDPGMFGRMFPMLSPLKVSDAKLEALANAMLDGNPGDELGNNPNIPAGFTYFGQFVDHDITLDLTSLGDKENDPLGTENFRTPSVDLDCIYGLGPDGSPHLYARDPSAGNKPGPKLLIGKNITVPFGNVTGDFHNDLPRSPEGFALIGDHRNDENLLVAQTHLAMLKFHNAVCDMLAKGANPPAEIFKEARRIVTWHYQWIVLHDWVERLTGKGIIAKVLHDGRRFYRFKKFPYIPVEFSAAAYRLGHSMVRQRYGHNNVFPAADFQLLFDFSGLSGGIIGDLAPSPPTAPTPVERLPSNWIIDWRRFYDLGPSGGAAVPVNASRRLDPYLVKSLHTLPGGGGNLAFRNLKRGVNLGLPSGQDVAKHMKIKNPLTPSEIASDSNGSTDGAVAKQQGLHTATPLWYYILKEAKVRHDGLRLGPVGSTIISEVFVGLVHGDHNSFLWQVKNWKPTLPSQTTGNFTMTDMLRFVNDTNPIGRITQSGSRGAPLTTQDPSNRYQTDGSMRDENTTRAEDRIGLLANRAKRYVSQHFGGSLKWAGINLVVWNSIGEHKDHELTLADVDEIAKTSSAESNEVLAVLALLSRPASGLLKMEYIRKDGAGDGSLSKDEVTKQLRAWWREKTITDDAWRSWAGKIVVKWTPADFRRTSNDA